MNHIIDSFGDSGYVEDDPPMRKVDVCVSVTLSNTMSIWVNDYKRFIDEDGIEDNDYSQCNLKKAIKTQVVLPQDTYSDWNVDDFEVLLDD